VTQPKSNMEKWIHLNDGLPTPVNMMKWAWVSMISSALQRRVWIGQYTNMPLFSNNYHCLVGPPGCGKSLIIKRVKECLTHWKLGDNKKALIERLGLPEHNGTIEASQEVDNIIAMKGEGKLKAITEEVNKPDLIYVGADATTYEALVTAFGKCYRRVQYKAFSEKSGKNILQVYGHASVTFCLPEFASLLRKRVHDTVKFLLGMYDAQESYIYDTVSREQDRITKGCLNILAAANPGFIQECFNEKLIDSAFPSRMIFVYAKKKRKAVMFIPDLNEEQEQYRREIKEHLLNLSCLYGEVKTSPVIRSWLEQWWETEGGKAEDDVRTNPKLIPYFARKNIHLQKLAMALHFSDSCEMEIPIERFKEALAMLEEEEKTMAMALNVDSQDTQSKMAQKILEIYKSGDEFNFVEIYSTMYETLGRIDKNALVESIEFLVETDKIKEDNRNDPDTNKNVVWWRVI
jgi:hypothetical protein